MFFKKKKISSKPKIQKTPYILGSLGVIGIFFLWMVVVQAMNNLNFRVFDFASSTGSIIEWSLLDFSQNWNINPSSEEDMIYILLTWKGGGNHDAPNLTDTLILVGIHPSKKTITLFSIPRDLYVEYPESTRSGKINQIYETYLSLWEDIAIEKLKSKISEITWKNIDFYVNVDFAWFIQIVDTLGWVEVSLAENFVDYEYPDNNLWYKTFILRKWTWILDWEVALMYARSRHSTSDFDRSLRQQNIISSLRKKVSQLWYFRDSKKLFELYGIFQEYVDTDMGISDMVRLWLTIKSWDTAQTLSFNLNDSCYDGSPTCNTGGFLYVPLREYFWWASVLLPNEASSINLSNYDIIHTYSDLIYDHSDIYSEPKDIVIFNATSTPLLAWDLANLLRPYGFSISKELGAKTLREKKFEKSILYYNGIDENNSTLNALKEFIDIEMQAVAEPLYSPTGTNIEIILAETDSF